MGLKSNPLTLPSLQMPLQTSFLGETVFAVGAWKRTFPAALPVHVPAQIAEHRITASALQTGKAGPRQTCRMKENIIMGTHIMGIHII